LAACVVVLGFVTVGATIAVLKVGLPKRGARASMSAPAISQPSADQAATVPDLPASPPVTSAAQAAITPTTAPDPSSPLAHADAPPPPPRVNKNAPPLRPKPPAPPSAAPQKAPAAANTDCSPPFYFDADGKKHYKPNCI
jgi:hypothetical protein